MKRIAAGWYPDPQTSHAQRFFDGAVWTDHGLDAAGAPSLSPASTAWPPPAPPRQPPGAPTAAPVWASPAGGQDRSAGQAAAGGPWTARPGTAPEASQPPTVALTLTRSQRTKLIGAVSLLVLIVLTVMVTNARRAAFDEIQEIIDYRFSASSESDEF